MSIMNNTISQETKNEFSESNFALKIAFQTMKERCLLLQNRLATVEKENVALKLECNKNISLSSTDIIKSQDQMAIRKLQEKIDDLMRQKLQLTHNIVMVAAENQQMWNRLTRLTQANKSLGNKEPSLEEISLRLKNSFLLEKSELEQQCADMVELQSSHLNLQSIGFTYPEDNDKISSDHLKHYESRLTQSKEALMVQNEKLEKIVKYFEKKKGKNCKNCQKNAAKNMRQIGIQITMDNTTKENNYTQTSISTLEFDENSCATEKDENNENQICPLCGQCFGQLSFLVFNEHVLSHFSNECINIF